jgi:cytoplasmic iron level regulating protein YaaA (DUF328/UPF0246 family)
MLLLISPAKTLDFATPAPTQTFSEGEFLGQAAQLISELRRLAPQDICTLMTISDALGALNFDRFANWQTPFTVHNAKAALFAFQGDVYTGLQAETFSHADLVFAQQHLRILSGLYGLLRPLDLIQAYRLEMGTGFSNSRGKNLYEFWGDSLTHTLNRQLALLQSPVVINLASQEYFRAVKPRLLQGDIITPVFKDWHKGQFKIISFFAKKARGSMSAYIIKNRIIEAEAIKGFDQDGYGFNADLSAAQEWVFTRAAG